MNDKRGLNRPVLENWIQANGPDGISKLAVESAVSASTISKLRYGRVPVKSSTRLRLCKIIGVLEDVLFPIASNSRRRAS